MADITMPNSSPHATFLYNEYIILVERNPFILGVKVTNSVGAGRCTLVSAGSSYVGEERVAGRVAVAQHDLPRIEYRREGRLCRMCFILCMLLPLLEFNVDKLYGIAF